MRHSFRLGVVLLAVVATGCKIDPARELLERDLRLQEDYIYELEDELDTADAKLESTRRENTVLRKEAARTAGAAAVDVVPGKGAAGKSTRPTDDAPLSSPLVDPGVPAPPPGPDLDLPDEKQGNSASQEAPPGAKAKKIVINRRLTGPYKENNRDETGVNVVFEPRDDLGRIVKTPGEVSVVVIDPSLEGPAARVARWDFAAQEAMHLYRKTRFGDGLHLELPWPNDPPTSGNLKLFVRFTTPEGTKLMAEQAIGRGAINDKSGWAKATPAAKTVEPAPPLLLNPPTATATMSVTPASAVSPVDKPAESVAVKEAAPPAAAQTKTAEVKPTEPKPVDPPKRRRPSWSPTR